MTLIPEQWLVIQAGHYAGEQSILSPLIGLPHLSPCLDLELELRPWREGLHGPASFSRI